MSRTLLPALLIGIGSWVACGDYTIELDSGYRLMRLGGGGAFALLWPQEYEEGLIVGPSVVGYREYSNIIVGLVEQPYGPLEGAREGYFLVDKAQRKAQWSLSRDEWLRKLQEHGIAEEPRLLRPTRIRAWF